VRCAASENAVDVALGAMMLRDQERDVEAAHE
jgi:hypothetical protein